jgi:hypothetical protein
LSRAVFGFGVVQRLCAPVLRMPSVRMAAVVPAVMARAIPRVSVPVRWMSSRDEKADDGMTKEQLIAQFPVKWPWGQNVEVDNGKMKFKIQIPQDRPGARQHKLIFTPDVVPPVAPDVRGPWRTRQSTHANATAMQMQKANEWATDVIVVRFLCLCLH